MIARKVSEITGELLRQTHKQKFNELLEFMKQQRGLLRLTHFPLRFHVNKMSNRILARHCRR
jgi:hypothetical protein